MIFKYRIHCFTENLDKFWFLPDNTNRPTTCPTDTSHQVDLNSTVMVQIGEPQKVVQVLGSDQWSLSPRGMSFAVPFGTTASFDLELDRIMVLRGGVLFSPNASIGDYINVQVIDKNNVLKFGGTPDQPTVLGQYVTQWYVMPDIPNEVTDVSISQSLPAGVFVRVTYTSVSQSVSPNVIVNFISYVGNNE
jgi:hypothetical protein